MGNGDGALNVFGDQEGFGITFWILPYPKIRGGKIYSGFLRQRSPLPHLSTVYARARTRDL